MSYIRALNNPEGWYVFGSTSGNVEFSSKWTKNPRKFAANCENPFTVPQKIFNGLVKKFIKNYHENSEYKGFSVRECDGYRKYLLTYNGRSIKMWGVTWNYIVDNAEWGFLTRREVDRRIKLREKY